MSVALDQLPHPLPLDQHSMSALLSSIDETIGLDKSIGRALSSILSAPLTTLLAFPHPMTTTIEIHLVSAHLEVPVFVKMYVDEGMITSFCECEYLKIQIFHTLLFEVGARRLELASIAAWMTLPHSKIRLVLVSVEDSAFTIQTWLILPD